MNLTDLLFGAAIGVAGYLYGKNEKDVNSYVLKKLENIKKLKRNAKTQEAEVEAEELKAFLKAHPEVAALLQDKAV